jgi:hypothetical protein
MDDDTRTDSNASASKGSKRQSGRLVTPTRWFLPEDSTAHNKRVKRVASLPTVPTVVAVASSACAGAPRPSTPRPTLALPRPPLVVAQTENNTLDRYLAEFYAGSCSGDSIEAVVRTARTHYLSRYTNGHWLLIFDFEKVTSTVEDCRDDADWNHYFPACIGCKLVGCIAEPPFGDMRYQRVCTKTGWHPTSERMLRLDEYAHESEDTSVSKSGESPPPHDLFGTDSESESDLTDAIADVVCRGLACDAE